MFWGSDSFDETQCICCSVYSVALVLYVTRKILTTGETFIESFLLDVVSFSVGAVQNKKCYNVIVFTLLQVS